MIREMSSVAVPGIALPEQPLVLRLDCRVALRPDETIGSGDLDMAAAVMDEMCLRSVWATRDTLLRRAPIIWAIDSWVNTILSLPDRSRVCNRHRASRVSTVCERCSRRFAESARKPPARGEPALRGASRSVSGRAKRQVPRSKPRRAPVPPHCSALWGRRAANEPKMLSRPTMATPGRGLRGKLDDKRDHASVRQVERA